jgi:quinol monooxygenase YgiN
MTSHFIGYWIDGISRKTIDQIDRENRMSALYLAVSITAKPGKEAALKAALLALVKPTRAEAGCLLYDLHTDREKPQHLYFYEAWSDHAAWQRHNESSHINAFRAIRPDLVETSVLHQLDKIEP